MADISESNEQNDAPVTGKKFNEYIASGGFLSNVGEAMHGADGLFHEGTVEVDGIAGSYNAPAYQLT